jgi:predicted dehydrogenase
MHRIGLLGFGAIAENGHLPALQSFADVEVVAVADLSAERRQLARELLPGCEVFHTPLELIERADITGVDICTPPSTHADLVEAACVRGLEAIICEKPFVLSEDEFERVAGARERSGSRIISVNNWMHSHLGRRVREVLDAGSIGDIRRVELRTGRLDAARGNAGWQPGWRTTVAHAGGGIILDHGWHQLYLLMDWMNAWPQSVSCVARTVDPRHAPVEDEATIRLHFPDGEGCIELSWTSAERSNSGSIQGTRGSIEVHDDRIVVRNAEGTRDLFFGERLTQSSYHPDWFTVMLECSILSPNRAEADRNFAEAGVLVSTIRAAYRSAQHDGEPRSVRFVADGVPGVRGKRADPPSVDGGGPDTPT